MANRSRAELGATVDCNLGEGGLEDFEPEMERATRPEDGTLWLHAAAVPSALTMTVPGVERMPSTPTWRTIVVPVLVAATVAGALLLWVGLRGSGTLPAVTTRDVVGSSEHVERPTPAPAPVAPEPAARNEAAVPAPVREVAAPGPPPIDPEPPLDPDLSRTLSALSAAFRSLDAASVAVVWPRADVAQLAERFSELKYQALTFEHCRIRERTADSAMVSCDASLAMAPKSGDQALQRRHETWTLTLDRSSGRPMVATVSIR